MIETDTDSKSVGLSAPVSFPEHSNELYTSGWWFGSLNTGQYLLNNIEGLHVPPEYNQGGSQWDRWRFGLLFRSAEISQQVVGIRNRGISWGQAFTYEHRFGVGKYVWWGKYDPALADVNFGVETPIYANWAVNWSMIPQQSTPQEQAESADKRLDNAVDAVREILSEENDCSNFFKNRTAALNALSAFHSEARVGSLRDTNFPTAGILMQSNARVGQTAYFNADGTSFVANPDDLTKKAAYRVFGRIIVNQTGPFINKFATTRPGRYPPGFLQSQVLQILHELANMVLDENGKPLIPDDGQTDSQGRATSSEDNTATVLKHCKDQINALSRNK